MHSQLGTSITCVREQPRWQLTVQHACVLSFCHTVILPPVVALLQLPVMRLPEEGGIVAGCNLLVFFIFQMGRLRCFLFHYCSCG